MRQLQFIAQVFVGVLATSVAGAQCPISETDTALTVGGQPKGMDAIAGVALIGNGGSRLVAIDVSAGAPVVLGDLVEGPSVADGPFSVQDIEMIRDGECCATAFVAAGVGGLHKYSVDLSSPVPGSDFLSPAPTPASAVAVTVSESAGQVFVVTSSTILVYPTTGPLTLQTSIPTPTGSFDVAVDDFGDFAYVAHTVAGGFSEIQILDLIDETPRGQITLPDEVITGMAYVDRSLIVTTRHRMSVHDVSDPGTPTLIGSLAVDGRGGMKTVGSVAYVTGFRELSVIDVCDPTDVQLIGSIVPTWPTSDGMALNGAFAYSVYFDFVGLNWFIQGFNVPNFCFDVVNETQSVGHVKLQEAIDLAEEGDVVRVGSTTLGESNVRLDKRLTIIGRGRGESIIDTTNAPRRGRCMEISNTPPGTVVRGLTFRNGEIEGDDGGGGVQIRNAHVIFEDCDFTNNLALFFEDEEESSYGSGGAMAIFGDSDVTIDRALFLFNFAQSAAAIHADGQVDLRISNSIFTGHNAGDFEPKLIDIRNGATLVMTNATLANNGKGDGVLLSLDGQALIAQSIFWDNDVDALGLDNPQTTVFNSILPGGTGKNIDADPLFMDGAGFDFRLTMGSPAIDAGFNTALPMDQFDLDEDGNTLEPVPFDAFDENRRFDDPDTPDTGSGPGPVVDLGALEYNGPQPCSFADLAEPFGTVDFDDVLAFLVAFGNMDPAADFAPPFGTFDFDDILAFLSAFGDGCP